jgi:Zn-dependent peptidase ImmA (M78 family)
MKVTAAYHCGDVVDDDGNAAEPSSAPDFTELDAAELFDTLREWISAQGWKVTRTRTGSADGDTSHSVNRIRIHAALDGWDAVRTLVHEIAHAFLHGEDDARPYVGEHRGDIEAEAESVTFAVLTALGRDARGSVAYAAHWTRDAERVAAAFDRAANVADAVTRVALGETGVTVETTRKDARDATKASNRELAATLRDAGVNPSGDAWRMAKSGVPLAESVAKHGMAAAS